MGVSKYFYFLCHYAKLDSRLSITESMSRENRVEAMIFDDGKLHHVLFCLRI